MRRIVAIGEPHRTRGFGLVGCEVATAADAEAARRAWAALDGDVELVLLTRMAAEALAGQLQSVGAPLVAVMPE